MKTPGQHLLEALKTQAQENRWDAPYVMASDPCQGQYCLDGWFDLEAAATELLKRCRDPS